MLFVFCAAANASLSVKPSRVDLRIDKDDVFESQYELGNDYDGDVTLTITVDDWNTYKGNAGLQPADWLTVTPLTVHMSKGERKKVTYTVRTTQAMKGSLGAKVSFSLNPPGNDGLTVKMSFPIYANIYGTEDIKFEIKNILFFYAEGNLKASITVENRGNVNVRPEGKVDLYNSKKQQVYSAIFKPTLPVYTDSTRDGFGPAMPVNLEPGKYTAEIEVTALGKTVKRKAKFRIKADGTLISQ